MEELNTNKLTLIYSMFNKYFYKEAKNNIEGLESLYVNDPIMSTNRIYKNLVSLIKHNEYENISEGAIATALVRAGKNDDEINLIMGEIKNLMSLSVEQISLYKERFKELYYKGQINKANFRFSDASAEEYVKYLKENVNYISDHSDMVQIKTFDQYDVQSLVDFYRDGGIRSTLDLVNNTFYPIDGWMRGQIVMVIGAPGTGKSLFLQQECINMVKNGHKCYYIAMGDLTEYDMLVRMLSQYLHISMNEVSANLLKYYNENKEVFKKNLLTSVISADKLSSDEYVEMVLSNPILKDVEVLFIDYDSNFKRSESDSTYMEKGKDYNALTKLKEQGKLIFIASQPKTQFNEFEKIPPSGAAESNMKFQIVDIVLTFGKYQHSKLRMGIISLGKVRRNGSPDETRWIGCSDGTYCEVDPYTYEFFKTWSSKTVTRLEIEQWMKHNEQKIKQYRQVNSSNQIQSGDEDDDDYSTLGLLIGESND